MEWERERPSSGARALFLSNAFRRPDARLQSRSQSMQSLPDKPAVPAFKIAEAFGSLERCWYVDAARREQRCAPPVTDTGDGRDGAGSGLFGGVESEGKSPESITMPVTIAFAGDLNVT